MFTCHFVGQVSRPRPLGLRHPPERPAPEGHLGGVAKVHRVLDPQRGVRHGPARRLEPVQGRPLQRRRRPPRPL